MSWKTVVYHLGIKAVYSVPDGHRAQSLVMGANLPSVPMICDTSRQQFIQYLPLGSFGTFPWRRERESESALSFLGIWLEEIIAYVMMFSVNTILGSLLFSQLLLVAHRAPGPVLDTGNATVSRVQNALCHGVYTWWQETVWGWVNKIISAYDESLKQINSDGEWGDLLLRGITLTKVLSD